MRTVTANPTGALAAVIYDGNKFPLPDACPEGFRPRVVPVAQITPLFRGAFQFMAPRYNYLVRWDFTITHSFTTFQACQDFVGNRPAILPAGLFELMILNRTNQSTFVRYYKQALLTNVECSEDIGVTCRFRYSLVFNSAYSITP